MKTGSLFIESTACLLIMGCISCAARKPASDRIPQDDDWQACVEVMPAKPDGFRHYTCTDKLNRQYEVWLRRK